MLLRTLQAPPRYGSLREWVLILTLDRLEDVDHARFRALAQIVVDKEKGVEAFEDYMKIAFPSLEARKKSTAKEVYDIMRQEAERGPLKVTPLGTPWRSKLKQRVLAKMAPKAQSEKHDRVERQWQQQRK